MTGDVPLGHGAEFDAIRQMLARWGLRATGIGDDAAVLRLPRGDALVASVDSAVEGRHFRRDWLTPREIGYRAVAAALSDLAAMAAAPSGVLIAMSVPDSWRASIQDLADGVGDAVDLAKTTIRGGNLTGGTELSITTTVFGTAFAPLSRGGARAHDRAYVTGTLGAPGAALRRLLAGDGAGEYRAAFARPVPRLAEARWLANAGASAAIDISDSLLADAGHLAAASGVRIEIDAACVPLVRGVELERALRSGEEYELLVTSRAGFDTAAFHQRFGIPLTEIGRIVERPPGTVGVGGVGDLVGLRGAHIAGDSGYDHFSS